MSGRGGGRGELLRQKAARIMVLHGVRILSAKRDALSVEFRGVEQKAGATRRKFNKESAAAEKSLVVSGSLSSSQSLDSYADSAERDLLFKTSVKNVWGVRIPSAEFPDTKRGPFDRGSAPGYRNPSVDQTASLYERAAKTLMETAVAEKKLASVGSALKSVTRRVNALETRVAPELKLEIARIKLRLDEIEREDLFRLKRYKSLQERGS